MGGTDIYLAFSPDPCDPAEHFEGAYEGEVKSGDRKPDHLPPSIELRVARDVLWHEMTHVNDFKRIVVALVSFSIFIVAMFVHIPTTTFYDQSYAVSTVLAPTGSDTVTEASPVRFENIKSIPDIFDWLDATFVPGVFVTEDYNGDALPRENWGRVATFNRALGAVSFEVTRKHSYDCQLQEFLLALYPVCYDSSSTSTEELFISFDTNTSEAAAILTERKESGDWLGISTQQLVITVITFNGELRGYAVIKFQLDFNSGGYLEPSFSITPALSNQFPNAATIVLDILVVMWFLPWMLIPFTISFVVQFEREHHVNSLALFKRLCKETTKAVGIRAFPDGWLAVDVLRGPMVHAFYAVVVATHVATSDDEFQRNLVLLGETENSWADSNSGVLSSVTASLMYIARLAVVLRLLATLAVLELGLRVLNTFRGHVGLSILTRTVGKALRWLGTFSVIFLVIFMAFAASGTALFGDRVEEFSTMPGAMKTCTNMLFGEFDFGTIQGIDYSVVYYWSYMALETFVLLNIVLAIVIDAYNDEKVKKDPIKWWVFGRQVSNMCERVLAAANDLLFSWRCRSKNSRHRVVFCGKIRPRVLYTRLTAKVGVTKASGSATSNKLFPEWTDDTILTAAKLNELFPLATGKECEATLRHLVEAIWKNERSNATKQESGHDKVGEDVALLSCEGPAIATHSVNGKYPSKAACQCGSELNQLTRQLRALEARLEQLDVAALNQNLDVLFKKLARDAT